MNNPTQPFPSNTFTTPAKQFFWVIIMGLLMGTISCSSRQPGPTPVPILPTSTLQALPPAADIPTPEPATATATAQPENTPIPTELPTAETPAEPPAAAALAEPADLAFDHTVQPGESLLGLAVDYGVPIVAIQIASQLGESTSLQAGQILTIPPASEWQGASPYWLLYIVQPGDTLSGISSTYGFSMDDLLTANNMQENDFLSVDQDFILPFTDPSYLVAMEATPTPPPTPVPTATTRAAILEPTEPAEETDETSENGEDVEAEPTETVTETEPTPEPTQAPAAPPPPSYVAGWQAEVFNLINQVRAEHGLPPLAYNAILAVAAQNHAVDCQQRGWCSHTGSDGTTSAYRIARAGYQAEGTSECWVYANSAQKAVEYWMDEVPPNDPHRRTLLSNYLSEVGIGIAQADDWAVYFIADFGRPTGS